MRVIDAFDGPVRTVAVSPDGRFLAAASALEMATWDWISGEALNRHILPGNVSQLAFGPDSIWVARVCLPGVFELIRPHNGKRVHVFSGLYSGGIAVSPDAKTLVATRTGHQQQVRLEQWELPGLRPRTGVDFCSPFDRLAFSPNGEHIAGINLDVFELRYAESGGLNRREERPRAGRYVPPRLRGEVQVEPPPQSAYLTFPRHSETVVYGWDAEFRVMETRNGNALKRVVAPENGKFLNAVFLGTGRQLATVDGSPVMRVWSAESWEVVRAFDWGAGDLTCVTSSADGLAGICGTKSGKLVVFDVDE